MVMGVRPKRSRAALYGAVGEYEHRARTLDLALYQFDTLLERLALTDEYGYQLGRMIDESESRRSGCPERAVRA